MNPGWTLPVPLQQDELFSSWLARAALAQGCDPLVLTGEVWPYWRAWVRDPDRGVSEDRLLALAKASGVEVQRFEAASIRPTVESITTESLDSLALWPWVLALGYKNRTRLGGLQYCSACLATGPTPYYRLHWRLAWHANCSVHNAQLHDRCWSCKAPVQPHLLQAEDKHLAICSSCRCDFREACLLTSSEASLAFQDAADEVVRNGYGCYGTDKVVAPEWFRLSRYFLLILRRIALGQSEGLESVVKALGVTRSAIVAPATGLMFELLPVEERAQLLMGVWELLDAGPEGFREAAMQASLTRATFSGIYQPVPRSIAALVETLLDGSIPRVNAIQANGKPRPRSRQAVMRMFARLQRKMHRMT